MGTSTMKSSTHKKHNYWLNVPLLKAFFFSGGCYKLIKVFLRFIFGNKILWAILKKYLVKTGNMIKVWGRDRVSEEISF